MTTYLVRVLYSSTTLPIYQVFGTRHPDTDPSNVTRVARVLFFVGNVRRRKASSSWVSDLHVRAPRSLEAKPEGLAGGRSPAGTVAPADVAIVRRCSISFHDGFRRKAHTSRTVVAFRALFTKANAVLAISPNRSGDPLTRVLPPLLSSQNHCYEKRCVSRGSTRASLFFCFRDNPKRPKGTGPSYQAAARGFHSATRRSSAVERNVLILVRREKGTYYPRFGAATLGNGAETCLFVFYFFFPLGPGKLKRASSAAEPRGGLCCDDNTRGCLLVG